MTLAALWEALGLGIVREARLLVARLPQPALVVATEDDVVVRALVRAGHTRATASGADAALVLRLPDGDDGLALLERLARTTRPGGLVAIAAAPTLGRSSARARTAGLLLRAGFVDLRQDLDGGVVYTSGRVARPLG